MDENEILETTETETETETENVPGAETETENVPGAETETNTEIDTESAPVTENESSSSSTSDVVYIDANQVMLLSDEVESYAVGDNNGYQLPSYYVEYFRGVVDNLGDSEYIAFATRDYNTSSGYNSYTEHYTLVYDIEVLNDTAVSGTYPCIDIYRDSNNSYYTYAESTYTLSSYPSFSYGSFGHLSSLGKGDAYETVLTLCFGLAVGFVCFLLKSIFDSCKRK